MTRASLDEYAAVQRERYQQATRAEKRQLLDEVVAVTRMHRKAAIRLLRRAPRARARPGPGGRPRTYGPEVAAVAEGLWQASGRIGAHRLQPCVPELLDRLLRCGEVTLAPAVDKLVRQASRPTLARLLASARAHYPPRGASGCGPRMKRFAAIAGSPGWMASRWKPLARRWRRISLTRPGPALKHEIPIRNNGLEEVHVQAGETVDAPELSIGGRGGEAIKADELADDRAVLLLNMGILNPGRAGRTLNRSGRVRRQFSPGGRIRAVNM